MTVTHDEAVSAYTGGLAPEPPPPFKGSARLRPDGRPRPEFREELRRIPDVANWLVIGAALAYPVAIVAGYVWASDNLSGAQFWAFPIAFVLMGTVFPRLSVLNHEAAHRLLFSSRRVNDLIGEKLFGILVFGDGGDGYRRSHAHHHRDEFGPREPDFLLYSRYPIPAASWRRKLMRDAFGISGWKNLRPILFGLFRAGYRTRALKAVGGQIFVFALFLVSGHPWLYALLWFLPWMTYWRVVNRLRALSEHAGMTRSDDRRMTTHHIRQGPVTAFLFTPYNTGYHLAHHVDSGIPFRSLPVLHRALVDDGYVVAQHVYPTYRAFWRCLPQR